MKITETKFIQRVGNSSRLSIPVDIRSRLDLKDRDFIEIEQIDDKSFVVTKVDIGKKKI